MFLFPRPATTSPAPPAAPMVPAGADLVMKAVHDAGLNPDGTDPVMNEIFAHYAEEGHAPPELEWLKDSGLRGKVVDLFPGARGRMKTQLRRDYADDLDAIAENADFEDCVRRAEFTAVRSCEKRKLPNGELVPPGMTFEDCSRLWLEGRQAASSTDTRGTQSTSTQTAQVGSSGGGTFGIPGIMMFNVGSQVQEGTAEAKGTTESRAVGHTQEGFKGSRQRCEESAQRRHHFGEVE